MLGRASAILWPAWGDVSDGLLDACRPCQMFRVQEQPCAGHGDNMVGFGQALLMVNVGHCE